MFTIENESTLASANPQHIRRGLKSLRHGNPIYIYKNWPCSPIF